MNSKISLIVPVFNEEDEIENFFNELNNCNFNLINEIIFVNDCSTDKSYINLENAINKFKQKSLNINFLILNNFKNRGYGFSIKKGVDHSNNETIAIIDLDRTYKIDDLNNISDQFINEFKLNYDLISGQRNIGIKNTSRLKIIGKNIINTITNFCFNEKIVDYNSGLRVFNKSKFIKHKHMMSDRFFFNYFYDNYISK